MIATTEMILSVIEDWCSSFNLHVARHYPEMFGDVIKRTDLLRLSIWEALHQLEMEKT